MVSSPDHHAHAGATQVSQDLIAKPVWPEDGMFTVACQGFQGLPLSFQPNTESDRPAFCDSPDATEADNPDANYVESDDAMDSNDTNTGEFTVDEPSDVPEELAENSIKFASRFTDTVVIKPFPFGNPGAPIPGATQGPTSSVALVKTECFQ